MLAETLDALERQTRRDIEVIVVDDESGDETPDVVAQRADRGVRSIRVSRRGPGRARQVGWREARAPIVAFTDDDCIPTAEWLDAIVRPIEDGSADFVQGRTRPRPDQSELLGPWAKTQRVEHENKRYPTCNMAYRKNVLESLGGFRDEFTGPNTSGEDTDLGWRAMEAGYRSAFAPDALVHHAVWPSEFWAWLKDRPRWGMIVQVVRYHPGAREIAHRRYFYRPAHQRTVLLLLGLVGSLLVRRWLPPALAAAFVSVYLWRTRGNGEPAHRRALFLAQIFTGNVVEVAVFARASVRYRTLLI